MPLPRQRPIAGHTSSETSSTAAGPTFRQDTCEQELREFIVGRLGPDYDGIDRDTPLLEFGLLDSIMMQVVLAFLEDRYDITVPPEVVRPESFGSIRQMAEVVAEQCATAQADRGPSDGFEAVNVLMASYGLRRRWIELAGGRQHVLECDGDGPPLVLLPGLGSPASSFGQMMRTLKGKRRAIAHDQPGFRVSPAFEHGDPSFRAHVANTIELIETLGEPCVLVGTSAGGMVAAEVAQQRPDLCRALIFVSFGRVVDGDAWWTNLHTLAQDAHAFWQRAFHNPPALTEPIRRQLDAVLSSPAYQGFLDADARRRMDQVLDGLRPPTMFIGGQEDGIIEPSIVEQGANQVAGSRLEWIPRCGHFAHSERAQEVLIYIEHFLSEVLGNLPDAGGLNGDTQP